MKGPRILYEIELRLNGHAPIVVHTAATKMEARDIARREGARMWAGGLGPFRSVHLAVRRRRDNVVVWKWVRPTLG